MAINSISLNDIDREDYWFNETKKSSIRSDDLTSERVENILKSYVEHDYCQVKYLQASLLKAFTPQMIFNNCVNSLFHMQNKHCLHHTNWIEPAPIEQIYYFESALDPYSEPGASHFDDFLECDTAFALDGFLTHSDTEMVANVKGGSFAQLMLELYEESLLLPDDGSLEEIFHSLNDSVGFERHIL